MITSLQALDELATYTMSSQVPQDALARLAVAAGYEARGERVQAEHHLGMALGILSRWENHRQVSVAEVEGLLRLIAAIARGTPKQPERTELSPLQRRREQRMIDDLDVGGVVWG